MGQRFSRFVRRFWPFRPSQEQIRIETVIMIDGMLTANNVTLEQRLREKTKEDNDLMRAIKGSKKMPTGNALAQMQKKTRRSLMWGKRIDRLELQRDRFDQMKDTIDLIMRLQGDLAMMENITSNVQMLGVDASSEKLTADLDRAMAKWKDLSDYTDGVGKSVDTEGQNDSEVAISNEEVNKHLSDLFEQMKSSHTADRVRSVMDETENLFGLGLEEDQDQDSAVAMMLQV